MPLVRRYTCAESMELDGAVARETLSSNTEEVLRIAGPMREEAWFYEMFKDHG